MMQTDQEKRRQDNQARIIRYVAVGLIILAVGIWLGRGAGKGGGESGGTEGGGLIGGHQHEQGRAAVQYYTCGMHPWVILPKPGNCPICQMKLVPLDPSKFTSEIAIDPVMTQDIGVRVAPVVTGPLTRVIRTVGTVDYNETALRDVNLKVAGWVEKLHVDYTGQKVQKDQPLLEIYSPELYSAQVEYIQAYKASAAGGIGTAGNTMLELTRSRLENFGITSEQIRQLEQSGKPSRTMVLTSPFEGLVVVKNVYEGMKVEAGMQLLRIADLSQVWVMVALYEYQIPFIEVGQQADMTLTYIPGQVFKGKVAYIYPFLNPETRQLKVRLEFDNPDLFLKPGMYANVELRSTLARDGLLVPREAVIDTGTRQVAFVSLGGGRFEPRNVTVGVEAEGGMIEILDGLKAGEMVVVSGEFLLDSESRLRKALAKMVKGELAAEQTAQAAPTTKPAPVSEAMPPQASGLVATIVKDYLRIGLNLSSDTLEGVSQPASEIAAAVDKLLAIAMSDPHFWHRHDEIADVRGKSLALAAVKDIEQARQAFADLSIALSKFLQAVGVPAEVGLEIQELHCPMYRQGQGGTIWLQAAGEVRNPYYGKVMLGCYDSKKTLPVAVAAAAIQPATAPTTKPND